MLYARINFIPYEWNYVLKIFGLTLDLWILCFLQHKIYLINVMFLHFSQNL